MDGAMAQRQARQQGLRAHRSGHGLPVHPMCGNVGGRCEVPSQLWCSRLRDYWRDSARADDRPWTRMGVVAVRRVAVRLDMDGRALPDLAGLGHPRYSRLANADHRRVSEWVCCLCHM